MSYLNTSRIAPETPRPGSTFPATSCIAYGTPRASSSLASSASYVRLTLDNGQAFGDDFTIIFDGLEYQTREYAETAKKDATVFIDRLRTVKAIID